MFVHIEQKKLINIAHVYIKWNVFYFFFVFLRDSGPVKNHLENDNNKVDIFKET